MRKRYISLAAFMALELAAEEFGGVGSMFSTAPGCTSRTECPVCGYGLAYHAGVVLGDRTLGSDSDTLLYRASARGVLPFTYSDSDSAVYAVRKRIGTVGRVPFREWAKELNLYPRGVAYAHS